MINGFMIAIGGACGALMRYLVSQFVAQQAGNTFPWGTMSVNLLGSLIIGILAGLSSGIIMKEPVRLLLVVGFLGAFTTFSTFSLENMHLLRDGHIKYAVMNILLSNGGGLMLAGLGFVCVRVLYGGHQ